MNQTLLIELLTEELPPKALAKLGAAFTAGIVNGLKARDFLEADSVATSYASPRRLAVSITNVREVSPDKSIREKVLPVSVALDANGNGTPPLAKKLAALGFPDLTVAELERAVDGKAESFFYTYTAPGSQLATGAQAALTESAAKLPIPKLMSYQRPDGTHRAIRAPGPQPDRPAWHQRAAFDPAGIDSRPQHPGPPLPHRRRSLSPSRTRKTMRLP